MFLTTLLSCHHVKNHHWFKGKTGPMIWASFSLLWKMKDQLNYYTSRYQEGCLSILLGKKNQVVSQSTVTAVTCSDLPRVQGKVFHTVILNEVKKCLQNVRVKTRRRLKKKCAEKYGETLKPNLAQCWHRKLAVLFLKFETHEARSLATILEACVKGMTTWSSSTVTLHRF